MEIIAAVLLIVLLFLTVSTGYSLAIVLRMTGISSKMEHPEAKTQADNMTRSSAKPLILKMIGVGILVFILFQFEFESMGLIVMAIEVLGGIIGFVLARTNMHNQGLL